MKFRKVIAMLMSTAMCVGLLASCGGNGGNNGGTTNDQPANTGDDASQGSDVGGDIMGDGSTYELVVTNHDSSTSMGAKFLADLGAEITEASGGRITFVYYNGGSLVSGPESMDAVRNGVADMAWCVNSMYTGQFPLGQFTELPLNGITCSQMGSKVYTDMFNEIPEVAAEYKDYKVIEVQTCGAGTLSFNKATPSSVAELQGLRFRSSGSMAATWINNIGMVATSMPTSDVYESLEKGVLDGCQNDWHNIDCFSLYDVIHYIVDYNVNVSPNCTIMSKDRYNSLPTELQAVIDQYAGSYASDMAGWYWDSTYWTTKDKFESDYNTEIVLPSDEFYADLTADSLKEKGVQEYIDYVAGYNVVADAEAYYNQCAEIVARYADDYQDPYNDSKRFAADDWATTHNVADYQ